MPPAPEGANLPPQDLDAEEAVLGAMMINEQAVLTVSDVIRDPGDFYREAHGTVFRAILALLTRSEPIDAVTVSDELERMGKLEDVGGRGFIFGLSSSVTVAANAKSHAQIVRDLSLLRRVAAAGDVFFETGEIGLGDLQIDCLGEQQSNVDADAVADQRLDCRQAFNRRRHLHHQVLAVDVFPEPPCLGDRA